MIIILIDLFFTYEKNKNGKKIIENLCDKTDKTDVTIELKILLFL
jgi:hypothetical protein|tara:strand:+ start:1115 stop:1249 length:135 start_codon:yes stop_codon:yes gene_type:complete